MNSLNLLSARVIGQSPLASRPRSRSQGEALRAKINEELLRGRSFSEDKATQVSDYVQSTSESPNNQEIEDTRSAVIDSEGEKQPLLNTLGKSDNEERTNRLRHFLKRLSDAITAILSTIGFPLVYVARCFQDETGRYSPLAPFKSRKTEADRETPISQISTGLSEKPSNDRVLDTKLKHSYSDESLNSATSESDTEQRRLKRAQKKAGAASEEPQVRRQSARIKLLHNDEAAQKRRRRSAFAEKPSDSRPTPLTVDSLKSPTSASASLRVTRYPHALNAPRPIVPRRQPSYSNVIPNLLTRSLSSPQQKTLVLDLDETLIHSMAKGGRMSTGHMVEVKLNVPVAVPASAPGHQQPALLGPQHPILYYVHKRPHCDEFLRKVCKWYKLVVFTASVQEYADPVVDWLEQERKYFAGRYYRQHCTFRNGSYIKDLSSIEPDLSKVIILDNSPVSYIFHEDNAIPIEGWINDPTDNDLLHLIPMLEALQYVTDVRALLALRRGEADVA